MPLLSRYARRKKLEFLLAKIRPEQSILEIGPGDGWLGSRLRENGIIGYRCVDLKAPADYVGDILDWRALGIPGASFDFIIALEVVEHVPCLEAIRALLKPGGQVFLTSPAPRWDWLCALLEKIGLSQKRTSPHAHLIDFEEISSLEPILVKRVGVMSQWGLFRKPLR